MGGRRSSLTTAGVGGFFFLSRGESMALSAKREPRFFTPGHGGTSLLDGGNKVF